MRKRALGKSGLEVQGVKPACRGFAARTGGLLRGWFPGFSFPELSERFGTWN